jgi:hypothetical protein
MKEKILQLVSEKPKHFARMVKNNPELWSWVIENALVISSNTAEMIYSALSRESNQCDNGNTKRFISVNDGFGYCGMTKNCQCAQIEIGKKVSDKKTKRSKEDIQKENKKREATSLEKYGVMNNGQTDYAKQKHAEFYADKDQVRLIVEQIKQTTLANHGVENAAFIPGIEEVKRQTSIINWGTEYPMQSEEVKDRAKQACIDIYGVDNAAKNDEVKDRISQGILGGSYFRFKQLLESNYRLELLTKREDFIGTNFSPIYEFKCVDCGSSFKKTFLYNNTVCRTCHPCLSGRSLAEIEVFDFVQSKTAHTVMNNVKDVIDLELDIYVPELNLAVEYCGLYWHSDLYKKPRYHMSKMEMCNKMGIKLITIFEDEWLHKNTITKGRLANALNSSGSKIFARKCAIKEVPKTDANDFVDQWHLQGRCPSQINLGLYYDDDMVSIMTFGKSRFNKDYEYELVRFCSSTTIVGGASKLFKYFIENYNPKSIVSYSDNRWGSGNLYQILGFEEVVKNTIPTYYYTDYDKRYNRQKFQKHKLVKEGFDKNKSESEIMKERGFAKIYDCGQTTWMIKF